jgi:hypothetical protein
MNVGTTKMSETDDDMKPHYDFDYSKANPNRFADKYNRTVHRVGLAPDLADEFPTEEAVNDALRDYMRIMRRNDPELPAR